MIKTQILLRKTIEGNRRLGLGSGLGLVFFCFILNSLPLTRGVTLSKLYLDGKNMRRKCQMNNVILLAKYFFPCYVQNANITFFVSFAVYGENVTKLAKVTINLVKL